MNDWKLCYTNSPFAWFTTASLDEQWGDDWNDTPWQHNAGAPSGSQPGARYAKVAFEGSLVVPGEFPRDEVDGIGDDLQTGVSVEQINRGDGDIPWLMEVRWETDEWVGGQEIHAGIDMNEFAARVEAVDGVVYTRRA